MHRKLEEIVNRTKEDLLKRKRKISLDELKTLISRQVGRGFIKAIENPKKGSISIIAEIKLSSPTQVSMGCKEGIIDRVSQYEKSNVDSISVVTEKHFFGGDPEFIGKIKKVVRLPVLQKDFVVDPYQVYEAKIAGADALLLIAGILSEKDLTYLVDLTKEIGIEPVVEVVSTKDLRKAFATKTKVIAVNARDLDTFEINLERACRLLKKVPDTFIKLGFSGVKGNKEVRRYKNSGAIGVLIGTNLMKSKNISEFIERLRI